MCKTKRCKNRIKGDRLCNTCASRLHRKRHPIRYAYDTLKHNCKRRKGAHFFYLTFEEFKQYAIETDYMKGKGITKDAWTIDRIDPTMGYFIGNIRPLRNSENSRKRRMFLKYEYVESEGRMIATLTKSVDQEYDPLNPF